MARLILYVLPFIAMLVSVVAQPLTARADTSPSRVFVTAYPCTTFYDPSNGSMRPLEGGAGEPTVSLLALENTSDNQPAIRPSLTVTRTTRSEVDFYFDISPGNYGMFVSFPKAGACFMDGHLIVLTNKNRHMVVSTCHCMMDWHARSAIAGTLPFVGLSVDIWHFSNPQKCAMNFHSCHLCRSERKYHMRL